MSIQNALTFLSNVDTDPQLRKSCYTCKSKTELLERLKGLSLAFTPDEFEDAINNLLLKCQTYEQANHVKMMQSWFSLFP
jgi:hypothetical protein